MVRTSTAILLITGLLASPAIAQTYTELDADADARLTNEEFRPFAGERFSRFDSDRDERISANEFDQGLFDYWDLDNDDRLAEAEWNNAGNWGMETGEFAEFDADADGYLTEDEFGTFDTAGVWETWDADNDSWLTEDEFGESLYASYDAGDDGFLDENEFGAYGDTAAIEQVGGLDNTVQSQEIISLADWRYDSLYADGISAERLIGDMEVVGPGGEVIGSTENLLIGPNGDVVALVAEIGGFWDIGDTHVSVPWDRVEVGIDNIVVPVTEETLGEYSMFGVDQVTSALADREILEVGGDGWGEVQTGPRIWRINELIGDYVRVRDGNQPVNYGTVDDVIIRDGQIAATVIAPDVGYGVGGRYAYPYYGYGWAPGNTYYDLPYRRDEIGELEQFDYEEMDG